MTARLPPEVRALRGTRRPDRDTSPAPATLLPRVTTPPAPPSWLTDPEAIAEWSRASTALAAVGLLHAGALSVLAHYCRLHSHMAAAADRGEAVPAAYYGALRNLASSLGLVLPPTARTPTEPKAVNPFTKFKRLPGA